MVTDFSRKVNKYVLFEIDFLRPFFLNYTESESELVYSDYTYHKTNGT